MKKLVFFLFFSLTVLATPSFGKDVPRIVNFINFVRDIEPRDDDITPQVLFETVKSEAEAIHQYGFRGTWLLQYDALIDSNYQTLMKEEIAHGCEVGGWWEITQPHVEDAGYTWRGRFPWDWHADKGFSVGYTQEERERLVDIYMEKFKEIFGKYPSSIGSWFIDAHTMAYMRDKYGIEGCCICRDQVGTDGYTLWGGYWAGAYYPSKVNAYMPAQTREGQIDLPVFRMLGSDPLYQYSAGVGGAVQSVCTMEPTYEKAQQPEWVEWYLRCQTDDPALGFTYFQAGQENSFTWDAFKNGYDVQLPRIASLQKQGKLRVETLQETARAFKKKYPLTPATACTALSDYTDKQGRTLWFNSRYYRMNILWEGSRMGIRDIHLFNEKAESQYYRGVCTSNQCVYTTLPIVDGCLWSTEDAMASLRFYVQDENGQAKELQGSEPFITQTGKSMSVRWPLVDRQGDILLHLTESRFTVTCTDKTLQWYMQLNVQPQARLPFLTIGGHTLKAEQDGFPYQLTLHRGIFTDLRPQKGQAFRIQPEKGKVEMNIR
ncbi:MAG: hypothetical protein IJ196_06400 [Prevotella sp.]|nr:hypothetical protein [Prevotella sp.]